MFTKPQDDDGIGTMIIVGGKAVIVENIAHGGIVDSDGDTDLHATWSRINADVRAELMGFIEAQSGVSFSEVELADLLNTDTALLGDLSEWGVEDADVIGRVLSKVSDFLMGRKWPTFGENADFAVFLDELRSSATAKGIAVMASVPVHAALK